jgi:chromosome segregation ATPase
LQNKQIQLENVARKLEQEKKNLLNDNGNKEKALNNATLNIQENERVKRKLETAIKNLENEKKRLIKEKMDALKEKEDAKAYMNSLTRDFDWLKKQTDVE